MIIKIEKEKPPKKYGNYFLAFEAPDDEEENTETNEIEPVEVEPEDTDFTDIGLDYDDIDMGDTEDPVDIDEDDTDFTDIGFDDETDEGDEDGGNVVYQADEEPSFDDEPIENDMPDDITEEPPVDTTGEETPQEPEEEPVADDQADTDIDAGTEEPTDDDVPPEETTPDDTGETPEDAPTDDTETPEDNPDDAAGDEEINPGDEDDFTDIGSDEGSVVDDAGEGETGGEENNEKKGPGLEYDSTRKYNLFKEYQSLYNAICNYISKLENNVKDDMISNKVIKDATDKLREIKSLCYDYMLIKFEISTYTQSLVFYQTLIVAIQSVFRLLTNIHVENNDSGKPEKQSLEQ